MVNRYYQIETLVAPKIWAPITVPMPMAVADTTIAKMLKEGSQRLRSVEVKDFNAASGFEVGVMDPAGQFTSMTIPLTATGAQLRAAYLTKELSRPVFFRMAPAVKTNPTKATRMVSDGVVLCPVKA